MYRNRRGNGERGRGSRRSSSPEPDLITGLQSDARRALGSQDRMSGIGSNETPFNLGARPKTRKPSYAPNPRSTHFPRGQTQQACQKRKDRTHPIQDRQTKQPRKPYVHNIGYTRLVEMSNRQMHEREEVLHLISSSTGLKELLERDRIGQDWIVLLLKIFSMAIKSSCTEYVLRLLNIIVGSPFLEKHLIVNYLIQQRPTELEEQKVLRDSINYILQLITEICGKMPTCVSKCQAVLIVLNTIPDKLNLLDEDEALQLKSDITTTKQLSDEVESTSPFTNFVELKTKKDKRTRDDIYVENRPPPDDFRDVSVYPTHKDIHDFDSIYVRPNKDKGKFEDTEHYLDVQFRLLREDYVRPLRESVTEFKRSVQPGNALVKLSDARMYNDVRIISPKCASDGIVYTIQFDTDSVKNVRWESSKRLIYGSLLCLSNDNFESLLFAVVNGRDIKELKNGFIDVKFTEGFELNDQTSDEVYKMIETTAFFEAYRHVLAGLQEFLDELPFERYIVDCLTDVNPPKYLRGAIPIYDLSCCVNEDSPSHQKNRAKRVPILRASQWPTTDTLALDQSQLEALKTSLTKEFAIIQGPPGTGKTYVGLKIVRALLENSEYWGEDSPILVVCYTNHALDQFLEGMLDFGVKDLLRVGGRSKSSRLSPFSLKEIKAEKKKRRQRNRDIMDGVKDCWKELKILEGNILQQSIKLEVSAKGILRESALRDSMSEEQYDSFKNHNGFQGTSQKIQMAIWLTIDTSDEQNFGPEFGKSNVLALTPAHILTLSQDLKEKKENAEAENLYYQGQALQNELLSEEYVPTWKPNVPWKLAQNDRWLYYRQLRNRMLNYKKCELNQKRSVLQRERQRKKPIKNADLKSSVEALEELIGSSNDGILLTSHFLSILDNREKKNLGIKDKEEDKYLFVHWLGYTHVLEMLEGAADDSSDIEDEYQTFTDHRWLEDEEDGESQSRKKRELLQSQEQANLTVALGQKTFANANTGEWQTVTTSKRKREHQIKQIVSSSDAMSDDEAHSVDDIWSLDVNNRRRLYCYWLKQYRHGLYNQITVYIKEYESVSKRLRAVRDDEDLEVFKTAKVIGMTTTGAAKHRHLLQCVQPRIIVVEEAAEVLEAHIISSLSPSCEHLILIGDHKQLRPSAAVYDLAKRFNLELSLFERMVNNGVRCDTLQLQHRMRPEIAEILKFIYPRLQNHASVEGLEHVKGIGKDIYFLDHTNPEVSINETKSKSNTHEAAFVVGLCRYLILQGYKPTQITILATYTGQLFEIKKCMPKGYFGGVLVTAVDNFQGEENDIIILSLVRSNSHSSIGFLSVDNRVCVALSRAKKGLYVTGNFSLLINHSPLWANVVSLLKSKDCCGPTLELYCQNHPNEDGLKVSTSKDFDSAPEGGCMKLCEARLKCGHTCVRFCHILDSKHEDYKCRKRCSKKCGQGHQCKKLCYQKCGQCSFPVKKRLPSCGHEQDVPCYMDPQEFKCQAKCESKLSCGHDCAEKCGNNHTTMCRVSITRKWPCGHVVKTECYRTHKNFPCPEKCHSILDCGHTCTGTCGQCSQGKFHKVCSIRCQRVLVCGHVCQRPCHTICPPCREPCENRCPHNKCDKKCGQKCMPCNEKCEWKCKHYRCRMLCGDPCDRPRCDRPCRKRLGCGHECIGLCGEQCPPLCRVCNKEVVCEIFFGDEEEENVRFILLEDCGHIFSVEGMDRLMLPERNEGSAIQMKKCPKCRVVIRKSLRYGNCIKQCLEDMSAVKAKILGDRKQLSDKHAKLYTALLSSNLGMRFSNVILSKLKDKFPTQQILNVIENQISLFTKITQLKDQLNKYKERSFLEEITILIQEVEKRVERLQDFVTEQQLREFQAELKRISYLFKFLLCVDKPTNTRDTKALLSSLTEQLRKADYFSIDLEERIVQSVKHLEKELNVEITEEERQMIVKAVGLSQGHWFKCPNGHVYAIGECGGAMEESKCPDCGKTIGGTRHRLQTDNQVAGEMDGARYAAWSEQANLDNYDPILFQ